MKRPPRGFDPNHRFIDDLKRKDFIAGKSLKDSEVTSIKFADDFLKVSKSLNPLNEFISDAIGLPW